MTRNLPPAFLNRDAFQSLIDALHADGYDVIAPKVTQEAIVYDEIASVDDLPAGIGDEQRPGHYRLVDRDDAYLFDYVVGPHSWKKYLFPPMQPLSAGQKAEGKWTFQQAPLDTTKRAFLGVRACELAAIAIQDRVFLSEPYVDQGYRSRRENSLLIAVNCTQAASTCFCHSAETGPECQSGFDLALTELDDGFVIEVGSDRGRAILDQLVTVAISEDQIARAAKRRQQAVDQQSRALPGTNLRDALLSQWEHPHWQEVGERCLGCTNCTMVCPTCFCSTVDDVADLSGDSVSRTRHWDSCFNLSFSRMSHGVPQNKIAHRYRQWLTHKLGSWHDQFDTSGCVGCGRCIAWCPVGIDITEEVKAIVPDDVGISEEVAS